MEFNFIELLGYLATFFVAASFLFKSIVHLRVVNAIGAVLFVVYSLIIKCLSSCASKRILGFR